ncbi:MAG TPA: VOC family protein [Afifellaceae bacterium]|nr:VOC family protein [Afifellaceae bacterium]
MSGAHISMVTLGVADIARSVAFYQALGWRQSGASQEAVAFLQGGNVVLGLFGRAPLAEDAAVEDRPTGFSAVALAVNLPSEADVEAFHARALAAGAKECKAPQKVFWGGFSGYFSDPDGHLWELAYNPFFPLDENGAIQLPEAEA